MAAPSSIPTTMTTNAYANANLPPRSSSANSEESLSPLEQEVLDEYARLLENMNTVRPLSSLSLFSPLPLSSITG